MNNYRGKLLIRTLCNKAGKLILGQEDIPTLMNNMSAYRMETIFEAAQKLNKITEDAVEAIMKHLNTSSPIELVDRIIAHDI